DKMLFVLPSDDKDQTVRKGYKIPELDALVDGTGFINKLGQLFDSLYTGGGLTNVELNNFYEEGTFTASDGLEGKFGINFPIRRGFFNDDPNASGWDIYTSLSEAVSEGGWNGDWDQLL
ncbi:hypothetical protein RZS08_02795, partial [Arthrospira platensis SPKY1]|nr:hypothetical protein [Arthrospira platensis SPKY1]